MDGLIVTGRFERPDHTPVTGAAVHAIFLGDPPGNCGTVLDLERAPAHTDDSGQFQITFRDPDRMLREFGPPGIWRRGGFLVVGVKDGRTIGYTVASGDELGSEPVRLTALATAAVAGRVVEGRCRFGELPPGDYTIRYLGLVEAIEAWRRQGLPWTEYSIRSVDGPRDRLALPVIEVGPLAVGERREIEATAVEGSVLCGTVRQAETRAPIEHARVGYEGPSYPRTGLGLQSAYADAEGRFATRTALVPGPLTIWVSVVSGGKRFRLQREVIVGREPRTELDLAVPFESSDTPGE